MTTYIDIEYGTELYADEEDINANSEAYFASGEGIELPITYS